MISNSSRCGKNCSGNNFLLFKSVFTGILEKQNLLASPELITRELIPDKSKKSTGTEHPEVTTSLRGEHCLSGWSG